MGHLQRVLNQSERERSGAVTSQTFSSGIILNAEDREAISQGLALTNEVALPP